MNKLWIGGLAATLLMSGCATKDYVHEYVGGQVAPVSKRVDGVESRTSATESGVQSLNKRADGTDAKLSDHAGRLARHDSALDEVSRTARDALDRASAAGKLAEGRFLYEVAMTDDTLRFTSEGALLTNEARQQLTSFADKLKAENRSVYIEIQGHTDATGKEEENLALGQTRAEAVRRYLNMHGGIALHRMSVISYGEAAPVADNRTAEGRKANRRVVLVVLK